MEVGELEASASGTTGKSLLITGITLPCLPPCTTWEISGEGQVSACPASRRLTLSLNCVFHHPVKGLVLVLGMQIVRGCPVNPIAASCADRHFPT